MQNQQQHKSNNIRSKLADIVLSVVLVTGISFVPAIQVGIYGQVQQQQQPSQQNQVGLSQVIKQISEQVAGLKPGTNPLPIQQILIQLAKETAAETSNSSAIQTIIQIHSQITSFPTGVVSQALLHIAKQQAAGNTTLVTQVTKQAAQLIDRGIPGANALVQIAEQLVVTETPALNQQIDKIIEKTTLETGGHPAQIRKMIAEIAANTISPSKLANILETVPSVDIDPETDATLIVEPSSLSIEENTPITVVVSGTLTYINGSGIKDEVISTSIASPGQNTYEYKRQAKTDNKGIYEVDFNDVRLPKGTYEVMARASNSNYSNLSASTQFIVESLPLSFNDVFPYLAASGIIIGIVSYIPRWYIRKRERNNLTQYMIKIYDEYNKFSKSKEIDYLNQFTGLRMELIEILKEGKINESQYEMLDKKISDYIDRASKDVYKLTK